MSLIQPTRRGLIAGLASLVAAPALVRAESLMPISVLPLPHIVGDGVHDDWAGIQALLNGEPYTVADGCGIQRGGIQRGWHGGVSFGNNVYYLSRPVKAHYPTAIGPYTFGRIDVEGGARVNTHWVISGPEANNG